MSRSTPSATRATPTPTTTYPFTYTTYSTSLSSSSFSKPTVVPSMFPFSAAFSCSANSIATPLPSNHPIDPPLGLKPACVISNAREVNDHAFWDLYACCKGGDISAYGSPYTCTAECAVGDGQTWQELGECLTKRAEVVVCKPAYEEIGRNQTTSSVGSSATGSTRTSASGSGSVSASGSGSGARASGSTGAASTVGVTHVRGVKAAVGIFVMLAVGSVAGMLS
ncbi:hypothetical protein EK21DRAFT_106612 [Setomelanomma holmii]|uniref:Uncharacterized protein n=1 Tax=Setomelanomma holmii TaxID=210430 RepID=A0A9P4HM56_9PLEO|nr:hypothetical protein EK21DRAFT_106612 [Setomelanomma holmii]